MIINKAVSIVQVKLSGSFFYNVLLLFFGVIFTQAYAASDNATLTISGRVLANTCTIDAQSAAAVTLPEIPARDIQGEGTTEGVTNVDLVLKECGNNIKEVELSASGDADGGSNNYAFKNTSTEEPASGVALYFGLQTPQGDFVRFRPNGSIELRQSLVPGDNTLMLRTMYVGTAETVNAGNVKSVINLVLNYK